MLLGQFIHGIDVSFVDMQIKYPVATSAYNVIVWVSIAIKSVPTVRSGNLNCFAHVSKQIQIPVNSSKTDTGEFFSYMKIYSISSWMLSCMIEIFFNGCSLSAVFQCSLAITSLIIIIITIIRIIENVPFVNF